MRFLSLTTVLFVLLIALPARADNTVLAAGGGYKAYVTELSEAYTAETGRTLDLIFGNMGRVTAQAKAGGKANLVLGAEWFFRRAGLDLASAYTLGEGKLVIAWAKNTACAGPDGLKSASIQRIALPDPKRAIYGRAAMQYLESTGMLETLKDKLLITGTVPQVGTYLMSGETDCGFINLTHARKIADKIGGDAILSDGYEPIRIVVCRTPFSTPETTHAFLQFLKTDKAAAIARRHGL